MTRRMAVFFSDTHGGHRLGLCNPDVEIIDEDEQGNPYKFTPKLTQAQEYLWHLYTQCIAEVRRMAGGDPVHVFHVGDLTQGKAYQDQLLSTMLAAQIFVAIANMEPWFEADLNLATFRLAQGTGSHIFREGSATLLVAQSLRDKYPQYDIAEKRHGLATLDRVKIDYAHHGPSAGIREWTKGNQLRYYATSLVTGDRLRGKRHPRLIVRGHFHEWHRETVRVITRYLADILLLPSFCGMGEYGRQATGSKPRITNGLVVAEIVDGKVAQIRPLVQEMDLRGEETLA